MIWPFCPRVPMLEGISFRTDVLRAFSTEQRIRLTDIPRRSFDHNYVLDGRELELARNLIRATQPGPLEVPDWAFAREVTADQGDTVLTFDNTYPELTGAAVIVQDAYTAEVVQIASGDETGVTLTAPLAFDYPNGIIAPLLSCDALDGLSIGRRPGPTVQGSATFTAYAGTDLADDLLPTYEGDPIIVQCNRISDLAETTQRAFDSVDNGIARPFNDSTLSEATQTSGFAWEPSSRLERWEARQTVYALKGRQKAFWLPLMNRGIQLAASAPMGAGSITIRYVAYSIGWDVGHLFAKYADGSWMAFEVTASTPSTETESLTLAVPLAQSLNDAQIICVLVRMRQASDRLEWLHRGNAPPRIVFAAQEVPV